MWEMLVSHPNASKINELLMLHNPRVIPHASRDTLSFLTIDFSPFLVLGHVLS